MKIFVCIKQVPDTETKIRLSGNQSSIDEAGVKWVINPYDEFAIEEALKLKESRGDSTVTVVSLGPKKRVVEVLRTALAMGADDGIVIDAPSPVGHLATAKALAQVIQTDGPADIIFMGKLAIDDNAASVSQMLAEYLDIPHVTVVSKFTAQGSAYTLEREIEGGAREIIEINSPAVIAANKGLNQPRYASLPGIMKAKKKPLKEVEFSGLGIDGDLENVIVTKYVLPAEKPPVKMLEGDPTTQAAALVQLLREEAKVI